MRYLKFFIVLCVLIILGACQVTGLSSEQEKDILAPTGKLRVGVYQGSPTSYIPGKTTKENKGLGYELGQELAKNLGVPFEAVIFQKNADVLVALKEARVDVAFPNATPERAKNIIFSRAFMRLEQSYLVPVNSAIQDISQIDAIPRKIGVSMGSTSQKVLGDKLKNVMIIPLSNLEQALSQLQSGQIDVFATNKGILYELSKQLPGSRVLDGAWGYENFAVGIPKGRELALPRLNQFLSEISRNGRIKQTIEKSGLRGTILME